MKVKQARTVNAVLKALDRCPDLSGEIEKLTELRDELQQRFDGLGERAQSNDNGQALQSAIANLDEAIAAIKASAGRIDDAIGALNDANSESSHPGKAGANAP